MCPTCGKSLQVPGLARSARCPGSTGGAFRLIPDGTAAAVKAPQDAAPDKGMEAIEDCPECGKALAGATPDDVGRSASLCPALARISSSPAVTRAAPPRREEARVEARPRGRRQGRPAAPRPQQGRMRTRTTVGTATVRRARSIAPNAGRLHVEAGQILSRVRYPSAGETRPRNGGRQQQEKVTAGVCALLCGSFGVHKFILGMTTPASSCYW